MFHGFEYVLLLKVNLLLLTCVLRLTSGFNLPVRGPVDARFSFFLAYFSTTLPELGPWMSLLVRWRTFGTLDVVLTPFLIFLILADVDDSFAISFDTRLLT